MASTESSDLNGTGVDTSSRGWGAGPYLGIVLTDHLVLSASVLGSSIDSNQTSFIHLGFKSDRLQASTGLNGYWYNDGWRFTPGLNTSWSKEWEKETLGTTPDETLETGLLTPGLQLGKTLKLSDRATVEPWAGAAFDWTYVNRIKFAGLPASNDPSTDLRIQAGLNFAFGSNVQLALTAEAGGLLLKNLDTYAGEANLAIQF